MNRRPLAAAVGLATLLMAVPGAPSAQEPTSSLVLHPDRVFDGERMHEGWAVVVEGDTIVYAGPAADLVVMTADSQVLDLEGTTLMPGLIEGHSHFLLHPYDETAWTDQVLLESLAERTARAVVHAEATLRAGVTTVRDLGTEGAGFADVGIKAAIDKGAIPGPRMLIATKALVTTGSYGPKGAPEHRLPKGAEAADGIDDLTRKTRNQIGRGADWIKVYADYRWGADGTAQPTFTQQELDLIVEIAASSGRSVVAHAATAEGMRRAVLAGVRTIEHGDGGDADVFALMAEHGVALCPTLAAGDAILQYGGWDKATDPEPARIRDKRASFDLALEAGVEICFGGDVGVYPHGDNVRELDLMHEYGMARDEVLRAATAGNASIFGLERLGTIAVGKLADVLVVEGDPGKDLSALRRVRLVVKNGAVVHGEETWN